MAAQGAAKAAACNRLGRRRRRRLRGLGLFHLLDHLAFRVAAVRMMARVMTAAGSGIGVPCTNHHGSPHLPMQPALA